jgi:hypothetical protein
MFLRNDVYEILLNYTPDRGKANRAILDWTDPEVLRELLRLRILTAGLSATTKFDQLWPQICETHVGSQESSSYLIDRSLMRPRSLIDLIQYCRSHALNLNHTVIGQDDIREGEASYSTELVANIGLEIRDVFASAGDVLYEFVGFPKTISYAKAIEALTKAGIQTSDHEALIDLLLWYGFLGVVRESGDIAYIYSVSYDKKRLKTLMWRDAGGPAFYINPAFWAGLEIV